MQNKRHEAQNANPGNTPVIMKRLKPHKKPWGSVHHTELHFTLADGDCQVELYKFNGNS